MKTKQPDECWIQTCSGGRFNLRNPTVDQVELRDIVRALIQINRFTGHTRFPYSVALHSVYLARAVFKETGNTQLAYQGLMHDAAEAYIGDVAQPLKTLLPDYQAIERRVERVIAEVFELPYPVRTGIIKEFDKRIQLTERNALFNDFEQWPGFDKLEPLRGLQIKEEVPRKEVAHRFFDYFLFLAPRHIAAKHLTGIKLEVGDGK